MKKCLPILILVACTKLQAQKIDSIYFHLYTDSLKVGVHNYINVDGLLSNGSYRPLSSKQIIFQSNTGEWFGNDLLIDSSYKKDSVVITASLRENPSVIKKVTIYIKKNADRPLKTEQQVLDEMQKKKNK